MANPRKPLRQAAPTNLLDGAVAELIRLVHEWESMSASGDVGVYLTLERGGHRRIRRIQDQTVMTAGHSQ